MGNFGKNWRSSVFRNLKKKCFFKFRHTTTITPGQIERFVFLETKCKGKEKSLFRSPVSQVFAQHTSSYPYCVTTFSGNSHTYLRHISGKYQINCRQIPGKSYAYLRRISQIFQAYLRQMSDKSPANLRKIIGKSKAYRRHILGISEENHRQM